MASKRIISEYQPGGGRTQRCMNQGRSLQQSSIPIGYVSLAEVLFARPNGITEMETWAILCQAVQALQDLFLSDGVSSSRAVPIVSPSTLLLSSRGRVTLALSRITTAPGYAAPEYQPHVVCYTDTDIEKMLVYSLGECLKRATLHVQQQLSYELCQLLTTMGRQPAPERASLMHLLDVISEYSKRRNELSKPFSHIVMDLYQETIIYRNSKHVLPDCALQPNHLNKQHLVLPCSDRNELLSRRVDPIDNYKTIPPSKWSPNTNLTKPIYSKYNTSRNIYTSLEYLNQSDDQSTASRAYQRPKSICTNADLLYLQQQHEEQTKRRCPRIVQKLQKRNPVQRAASRLYHVTTDDKMSRRNCVGPEFVIRAALTAKRLTLDDAPINQMKTLTVIMLNGVKLEVMCRPETTTAGKLFEKMIQSEDIEENYFLGLAVLISGDFVFLPSDVKLSKILRADSTSLDTRFTLFVRVRFFLPSLRGIRSQQTRHLLYLQLRRSILENHLPCTVDQLYELGGLALQAEFGDYSDKHEFNHYFLLEHYVPETLIDGCSDNVLRQKLIETHRQRNGLSCERAEEQFILLAQSLPYYGVHFYSATLILKNINRDVWLSVSAHGITLFVRSNSGVPGDDPQVYDMFKWPAIQTLCYSKHYLCILPHSSAVRKNSPKKFKLKMEHKKSYYTFRLASLHHQFFLRLRTEYTSLQTLSQQFGVLLKDMKNENNIKLLAIESKPRFETVQQPAAALEERTAKCRRSKSVNELTYNTKLEEFQNKENENPKSTNQHTAQQVWDKRKGVKMGTKVFLSNGQRISRSLEAVNAWTEDKISVDSLSTASSGAPKNDVYILDSSIKSMDDHFLPNFHETLSESLLDKLKNLSFADERILKSVTIHRDGLGSLGIQVTEGSDGKVYIQSVVPEGPACITGQINNGDQIVAVNNQNLLNLKYTEALEVLKQTEDHVEFVLSQVVQNRTGNKSTFITSKQINKTSDSMCNVLQDSNDQFLSFDHSKSQPAFQLNATNDNNFECTCDSNTCRAMAAHVSHVALPRSLGLSRKWRGPVRYPVTPIKDNGREQLPPPYTTADEEQIFFI